MIKQGNKRLTITFDKEMLQALYMIMFVLNCKQPIKAIRFALLDVKKRL